MSSNLSERGRGVYVRVGELAFEDVTAEVSRLERIKEAAEKVTNATDSRDERQAIVKLDDALKAAER